MTGLPLLLDLHSRRVLVVGAGAIAARRVRTAIEAGAWVDVVAPEVGPEIAALGLPVARRPFEAADVDGAWLVFACADRADVNAAVAAVASAHRVFCVRADDATGGSARSSAVIRRDGVTVAVNGGDDPGRAVALRDAIAVALDAGTLPLRRRRRAGEWPGRVALVGGGPGDDDLITVRGRRLVGDADVVVVDRLAPRGLLAELAEDVEIIDCGKSAHRHNLTQDEINAVLWRGSNLSKLALRPTYAGLRVHHGEVLGDVTATWPAILTREQHYGLRVLFGDPSRDKFRKDTRVKHLGAGIYRCGREGCDGVMRRMSARGGEYGCRVCHRLSRQQGPVDELVEAVIVARLARPDVLAVLAGPDRAGEQAAAAELVARLRSEESDMRRLLAAGDLAPADFAAWRRGWTPRLQRAEADATPATVPGAVAELAGPDAAQRWAAAPIEAKRAVLDLLMTVTIMPVGRAAVAFDPRAIKIEWK